MFTAVPKIAKMDSHLREEIGMILVFPLPDVLKFIVAPHANAYVDHIGMVAHQFVTSARQVIHGDNRE
jgi:hypothetical protein